MNPAAIRICQEAYDLLKDRLALSQERFDDACPVAATACMAVSHYNEASSLRPQNMQPCVEWVAKVGGWLKAPEPQAHLKSVGIDLHVSPREGSYLTLLQIQALAPGLRVEHIHPHINNICHSVADQTWRDHQMCGSFENLEKVCIGAAYLKCQAPLPWNTSNTVDNSFAVIHCVNRLAADPEVSLGTIAAQVYYHRPPTEYTCMSSNLISPYDSRKAPDPITTTCTNPPAPPRDFGPTVELQTSMMIGVHGETEQAALGTGIHLKRFLLTSGVSGSRHSDGVLDPTWSVGIYLGSNWAFWQPAPSVAFSLNIRSEIELNRTSIYPAAQAGAGVAFPELVGRYFVPQINVGYGIQGTKTSATTQWLQAVMVALNLTSRF